MSIRVGIVGVSGYGGGEALRICAAHPSFDVVYVAGESSAGSKLGEKFPGIGKLGETVIQKWDANSLPKLDLLIASLPTGKSKEALSRIAAETRVVDIGGDHRYIDGWTYGLADIWPSEIRGKTRIANPGCFPAASLTALAPLIDTKLIDPHGIIIDAKTGVSGAGRGGGEATLAYAEVNEDLSPYSPIKHVHMPEITSTLSQMSGTSALGLVFTPHLVPMTRGIFVTCYGRGKATTEQCLDAARKFYAGRSFVRVSEKPPHTKWATGSNLVFVSYACDPQRNLVIAFGALDNLGKGAAGQAVQNANLMLDLPEDAGLNGPPLWP
jgi:N-acetyl-gamma-glutamyl-phosphate reductase